MSENEQPVLLAGFTRHHVAAFKANGCKIAGWWHDMEAEGWDGDTDVPRIPFWELCRGTGAYCFCEDLPPDVSQRIADRVRTLFLRAVIRFRDRKLQQGSSLIDFENRLRSTIHRFYGILKDNGVGTVFFDNLPHQGTEIILYELCKHMGVRTVMGYQSPFPSAFWAITELEDFGVFSTIPGNGLIPPPLPESPEPPFYIKPYKPFNRLRSNLSSGFDTAKIAAKTLSLSFLTNRRAWKKNQWRLFDAQEQRKFDKAVAEVVQPYDPDVPFIYFPLHLQPELTTDVLGGRYWDQLLAIEEMLAVLPEGFSIYAKENPNQKHFMREDSFFERLRSMPRVRYIAPDVPSLHMIAHSKAVATVTGTAGWEAFQMGKPTILFGQGWYQNIPGMFQWEGDGSEAMADALAYKADRELIQSAYEKLYTTLLPGVVDQLYSSIIPDYDAQAEAAKAVNAMIAGLRDAKEPTQ